MEDTVVEKGIITKLEGNVAHVQFTEQSSCTTCGARVLCAPGSGGKREIIASNPLSATVGQQVVVRETGDILVAISFLQYAIPLAGFLLGVFGTSLSGLSIGSVPVELLWFIGGLAGLFAGGGLTYAMAKRIASKQKSYFEIAEILS